jgi:hypothetical protein
MRKIIQIAFLFFCLSYQVIASLGYNGKNEKEPRQNRIYSCVLIATAYINSLPTGPELTAFETFIKSSVKHKTYIQNLGNAAERQKAFTNWKFLKANKGFNLTPQNSLALLKLANKYDAFPNIKIWLAKIDDAKNTKLLEILDQVPATKHTSLSADLSNELKHCSLIIQIL